MTDLFANLGKTPEAEVEEEKKAPAQTKPAAVTKPVEQPVVEEEEQEDEDENREPTELELLRERAKFMSLSWKEEDTVEELKAAINAKLEGYDQQAPEPQTKPKAASTEEAAPTKKNANMSVRKALVQENMRLVRVRITNLDPKDKDLHGQIFTIDNEYLGTVSRFIPFGEATDNGTHIEYCLYKLLRSQKFLQIKTVGKGINARQETSYVRKFALDILPPLTDKELDILRASQLASGAID